MRNTLITAAVTSVLAVSASSVSANLLLDPSFESTTIGFSLGTMLTSPYAITPLTPWAPESSAIVGTVGANVPASGVKQLQVTGSGTYWQTGQLVDITSFAGAVDANLAVVTAGGLFDSDVAAALGVVNVSFFTGPSFGSAVGTPFSGTATIDGVAGTWDPVSLTTPIPAGTRWIVYQVAFLDTSMLTTAGNLGTGYVDDTDLDVRVVPEPSALGMLAVGGAFALRRGRRRAVVA